MNRRHLATAALLAASAITVQGFAAPAAHATLPATKVTTANLPTTVQMKFGPEFAAHVSYTARGKAQAPVATCQTLAWTDLGANREYTRAFFFNPKTQPNTFVATATSQVASFKSHAAAVKAADRMAKSLDCRSVAQKTGYVNHSLSTTRRTVTLKNGTKVFVLHAAYGIKQHRDTADIVNTAIFVTGTHAEMVSYDFRSQEFEPLTVLPTVKASLPLLAK